MKRPLTSRLSTSDTWIVSISPKLHKLTNATLSSHASPAIAGTLGIICLLLPLFFLSSHLPSHLAHRPISYSPFTPITGEYCPKTRNAFYSIWVRRLWSAKGTIELWFICIGHVRPWGWDPFQAWFKKTFDVTPKTYPPTLPRTTSATCRYRTFPSDLDALVSYFDFFSLSPLVPY